MFKKIISLMMAMLILSTTAMGAYAERNTGGEIIRFVGGGDSHVWRVHQTYTNDNASKNQLVELADFLESSASATNKGLAIMELVTSLAPGITIYSWSIDNVHQKSANLLNKIAARGKDNDRYYVRVNEYRCDIPGLVYYEVMAGGVYSVVEA